MHSPEPIHWSIMLHVISHDRWLLSGYLVHAKCSGKNSFMHWFFNTGKEVYGWVKSSHFAQKKQPKGILYILINCDNTTKWHALDTRVVGP